MDDIINKISGILSDEESLQQLSELAKILKAESTDEKSSENRKGEDCEKNDDTPDIQQIMKLVSLAGSLSQQDKNTQLLLALRPHISSEKQIKLDRAVKLLKLITVYNTAKESGLINNLI